MCGQLNALTATPPSDWRNGHFSGRVGLPDGPSPVLFEREGDKMALSRLFGSAEAKRNASVIALRAANHHVISVRAATQEMQWRRFKDVTG